MSKKNGNPKILFSQAEIADGEVVHANLFFVEDNTETDDCEHLPRSEVVSPFETQRAQAQVFIVEDEPSAFRLEQVV